MDSFVIYNPRYSQLRTALFDTVYGQKIDELAESCHVRHLTNTAISSFLFVFVQGLTPDESVPLLLAVYEVITQSHSYRQPSKHISVSVCIYI